MIILKHVAYKIKEVSELEGLIRHLDETTKKVIGVRLKEVLFPKEKEGFVLIFSCESEEIYHKWRKVCPPPPPGSTDMYEVFLTKKERFLE